MEDGTLMIWGHRRIVNTSLSGEFGLYWCLKSNGVKDGSTKVNSRLPLGKDNGSGF